MEHDPIDRDGSLTEFNVELLAVGVRGQTMSIDGLLKVINFTVFMKEN